MVGSGSYSMYKGSQVGNSQVKPTIYVEENIRNTIKYTNNT